MTNTLHRAGSATSFQDDYIVFAIASKSAGINDADAVVLLRRFLELALPFKPVNLGDPRHGGALRPSTQMSPVSHWRRDLRPDFETVIAGIDTPSSCVAVFDSRVSAEDFVNRVREENLGLSVNVSTSIDGAQQCCDHAGIVRHSVGYSLGFEGKTEKLPSAQVLLLSTMCGHGMVSASLAKKMIDWVREDRRTPEQAAACMARFCSCGVFNPSRAKRILEEVR